jgi:hypothetical protein
VQTFCVPRRTTTVCLLVLAVQFVGCASTYWGDRGRDLAQLIDLGVTVTPRLKPDFALHQNFFNVTPFGYSKIEGTYYGLAYGQFGALDFSDDSWGLLLYGEEDLHVGRFDPDDPHQFAATERRALQATGRPLPREMACHTVGVAGMMSAGKTPPWTTFMSCRKNIHLGWIGLWNVCRPVDLIDFVLGWSGFDLVGDDRAE